MGSAVLSTKDEFRNDSGGVQGVVIIDGDGKSKGIAVKPGETIWLSQEEQVMTANAPRDEKDNPLINGSLTLLSEGAEIINRRPLRPTEKAVEAPVEEPVPAAPVNVVNTTEVATPVAQETEKASDTPAPEGTRPADEEVATPDANEQVEEVATLDHQGPPVRRAKRKE